MANFSNICDAMRIRIWTLLPGIAFLYCCVCY